MHAITLLMKQHSYISVNREMKINSVHLARLEETRRELLSKGKKDDHQSSSSISDDASSSSMDSAETKGSSSQLKILQDEMIELETDLVNGGTRYPTNLTIGNFTDFLFLPTLVYELEYARNATVRIWYVLEKAVGTCFACFTMYLTVQHHVLPHIRAIQKQELFLVLLVTSLTCTRTHFRICCFRSFFAGCWYFT